MKILPYIQTISSVTRLTFNQSLVNIRLIVFGLRAFAPVGGVFSKRRELWKQVWSKFPSIELFCKHFGSFQNWDVLLHFCSIKGLHISIRIMFRLQAPLFTQLCISLSPRILSPLFKNWWVIPHPRSPTTYLFLVITFQYLRGALNYKAIKKYYDFNLQSEYKPSRMLNGLTTSHGEVFYVSSMIQVATGWRCWSEHKRAARIKIIMVMWTITLLNNIHY